MLHVYVHVQFEKEFRDMGIIAGQSNNLIATFP